MYYICIYRVNITYPGLDFSLTHPIYENPTYYRNNSQNESFILPLNATDGSFPQTHLKKTTNLFPALLFNNRGTHESRKNEVSSLSVDVKQLFLY